MTPTTDSVIRKHLMAARIGVDAVLEDYTDESTLVTNDATYQGLSEIRRFFTGLFDSVPKGFFDNLTMIRQEAVGELGYIYWKVQPGLPLATDTFVVRDGKILYQTFTPYSAGA